MTQTKSDNIDLRARVRRAGIDAAEKKIAEAVSVLKALDERLVTDLVDVAQETIANALGVAATIYDEEIAEVQDHRQTGNRP